MTIEPNDPAGAGAPLAPTAAAALSRNEIESLCLKAARGAGMDWGMAEEAGFAASWLSAHGIDGPGALLAQLRGAAGRAWSEICPTVAPGDWRPAPGRRLCPIALGAALSDFAALPETATVEGGLQAGPVDRPVLMLPFLSALAAARGMTVRLDWPGGTVAVTGAGQVAGDLDAFARADGVVARLSFDPDAEAAAMPAPAAAAMRVSPATLGGLNAFALRTTVPPSEASRAGAGAGTSDND